jgi:hypothetical protein
MISKKIKKKMLKHPDMDPDKMAKQANLFGWLAFASLFIFPLAAIPLGIIAITNGSNALKEGTALSRKARTGKIMGIVSLALVVITITIVVIILSAGLLS